MFGKPDKTSETGQGASIRSLKESERTPEAKPAPVNPVPAAAKSSGEPSVISADLKLIGNVQSAGDVQVDGTIEGDINSRSLTVGEGARIDGSITADRVRICGAVSGQVQAAAVSIARSARVDGDVTYQTLAVEEGAMLEGQCRRKDSVKAGAERRVSPLSASGPAEGGGKPATA
ncbi:MAG: polymer-forming cytoskeletal protein [Alphaproteobacteria bacterium]